MADPIARLRRRRWWRSRLRLVTGAVLLVLLVVGGGWALYFSSWLTARQVDVTGTASLSTVRVRAVAHVPVGRPLARLDLAAIQARVESIGAVDHAEVSRSWPHTVHIAVTERTPVAVVDRGAGLQQVDASGVLFGAPANRPPGMPLVKADPGMDSEALAQAGQVAAALPGDLVGRVDYLEVRSPDDIVLRLHDGRTVVWGSAVDSDRKADIADVLLHRKDVRIVDVSVPGRPTTRS
jgi:cell division protein FtsQ